MLTRYSPDSKGRAVRKALIYTKDEHGIKKNLIDPDAVRVISHLRNYGHEAYIVGGAVRDLLIGKTPKDFDIVNECRTCQNKATFQEIRALSGSVSGSFIFFFGEKIFEVSTFRSLVEGTIGNSFGTMDEDVQRRDFTLNALYYDPVKEQVIDYVGGVKDIRARRLEPVIPLAVIFKDDPVRMLRAIKYAVSTGSAIPFMLRRSIRKHSQLLQPVSPSRLTEEIIKILNSGKASGIVHDCLKFDLYMYLQPGANNLIDGNPSFAERYTASMKKLDELVATGEEIRLGRKLVFLIRDLVDIIAPRSGIPSEVYNKVYNECRRFVMPMNPPRVELEFAVRYSLKELGINVRMPRSRDRSRSAETGDVREDRTAAIETDNESREFRKAAVQEAGQGRPRRRRRRKATSPISASN